MDGMRHVLPRNKKAEDDMHSRKLIKWVEEQAIYEQAFGAGQASAFRRCHEEMEGADKADRIEICVMLESIPRPSPEDRMAWSESTRAYVSMLEEIVADVTLKTIQEIQKT
jgi:hypothetical protein